MDHFERTRERQGVFDVAPRKAAPLKGGDRLIDLFPVGKVAVQPLFEQGKHLRQDRGEKLHRGVRVLA